MIIPTEKARGHTDDEGPIKPRVRRRDADLVLKPIGRLGRVGLIEGRLSLKPYWGKLNVRNFREDAGNVDYGGS